MIVKTTAAATTTAITTKQVMLSESRYFSPNTGSSVTNNVLLTLSSLSEILSSNSKTSDFSSWA